MEKMKVLWLLALCANWRRFAGEKLEESRRKIPSSREVLVISLLYSFSSVFLALSSANSEGMCPSKEIPMLRTLPLATCLVACALVSQFFFSLALFMRADLSSDFTPRLLVAQLFFGLLFLVLIWGVWTLRRWGLGAVVGFEVTYIASLGMPPSWRMVLDLPVLTLLYYYFVPVLLIILCLIAFFSRPFHTAFFNWWTRRRKG